MAAKNERGTEMIAGEIAADLAERWRALVAARRKSHAQTQRALMEDMMRRYLDNPTAPDDVPKPVAEPRGRPPKNRPRTG